MSEEPFFCIVTPIFDGAYPAVRMLVAALQRQTYSNFIHILISNGPSSEEIKKYVKQLNDPRFIYDELLWEPTPNRTSLFLNICKRRNHCFIKYDAQRYMCLDADLKIISNDYFLKLFNTHFEKENKSMLLTKVKYVIDQKQLTNPAIFPKYPYKLGSIDLACISLNKAAAKEGYPTDIDDTIGFGNDYRVFSKYAVGDNYFLIDFISAEKDGNRTYTRFSLLND